MNAFEKAKKAIRFIGLAGMWNALRYSVIRDRLERRFHTPESPVEWSEPGPLQSAERIDSGARWFFGQTELEITFLAPDLVRCEWAGGEPLTRIPVLVRAGSLLPLAEQDRLVLNLYAPFSSTGGGQLYSDIGDGYGTWRLDRFTIKRDADGITVNWQTDGEFPL
jgi:hypothetical protein